MGRLIDETDLMNLLCALYDARHELSYAIKKIPELPPIEAIPKADYESRLKTDMVAMLTELQLEIEEKASAEGDWIFAEGERFCAKLFQQKINELEEQKDETNTSNK